MAPTASEITGALELVNTMIELADGYGFPMPGRGVLDPEEYPGARHLIAWLDVYRLGERAVGQISSPARTLALSALLESHEALGKVFVISQGRFGFVDGLDASTRELFTNLVAQSPASSNTLGVRL
jgi:hypothetical protein